MTISAIFRDGVLQPVAPLTLHEGERVQIEIIRSSSPNTRVIVSLKGIWKHAYPVSDTDDWVTGAISDIRRESAYKLDCLAQELSEGLGNG